MLSQRHSKNSDKTNDTHMGRQPCVENIDTRKKKTEEKIMKGKISTRKLKT